MTECARSMLLETDWNEEWMRLARERRRADVPAAWDVRARHFRPRETAPYARAFIRLMGAAPGESVLDMGCGGGSIAIPLARAGHEVIAADFSPAMLDAVRTGAAHYGVGERVQVRELAWADDWEAAGVAPRSVDVAIASRSIATGDLRGALMKLDRTARRRCCVTLVTGASPRLDTTVMDAIGAAYTSGCDYVYAFNILVGEGIAPEVAYIDSPRRDTFDSLEAGVADFSRMLEGGNEDRAGELHSYIEAHMVPNPHAGEPGSKGLPQGRYMLDHVRRVRWAFISWEPRADTDHA
ncbi:MAG: methyltransferase domain-containing protein [Coriobacteriaceae bacterium]|nr:methyltransferase domain-containing protein [Coriobacteriaceae bacterium]